MNLFIYPSDSSSESSEISEEDPNTFVQSVASLGKNLINTCPYATEALEWSKNSYNFLNDGIAEAIKKGILIPGKEDAYYPIKRILLLQKINLYVITDIKIINEILQDLRYGDKCSGGKEFKILSNFIGENSPLTETDKNAHKQIHYFANKHQFGIPVLKEKTKMIHSIASDFILEHFDLSKTSVFNLSEILPKYPIEMSSQIVFNLDKKLPEFHALLLKIESLLNDALLYHLKAFIPECIDYQKKQSKNELEDIVTEILTYSTENKNFIYDMMEKEFSIETLVSMIKTILIIGSGTTKSTLISAIYCLLKNPDYQEKLYQELLKLNIDETIDPETLNSLLFNIESKDLSNEKSRNSNLPKIKEIDRFLLEVMRLYSPIPVQPRENKTERTFYDITIKEGSTIFLANYLAYRNAEYWEDPNTFNPSRFEGVEGEKKRMDFHPFNWGLNICMGRNFANFMLVNFIYHFVMNFKIVPPLDMNGEEINQNLTMSDSFTYSFNEDVYVRLLPRK